MAKAEQTHKERTKNACDFAKSQVFPKCKIWCYVKKAVILRRENKNNTANQRLLRSKLR